MKRKTELPELLAPAGDFECLIAAVSGGADAIYIGGKMFSARAYAKNFDIEETKRAVSYCHLHGVRLYVTMNTLVYDNELDDALAFARELYKAGVDALIIADLGLIRLIRKELPDFELHASTQMSVHNSIGADEAYNIGCTRVVLARELSGKNIADVTERCLAETEVFLHGALCVCHSGQCLFSSMIGGRSGNRGECAQPCRLPYNKGQYILSLNDLSLAGHIRELIESGTASLKIEGRMKSPDYVYTVTSIYRRLLDEARDSNEEENKRLAKAFSRSGFTDGYFIGDTFRKMTGIRTEEEKREAKSEERGEYHPDKIAISASVKMKLGEPAVMSIRYKDEGNGERCVTAFGQAPEAARNAPLTESSVKERLARMGNTFLSLSVSDIELELDDGINLSPGLINALRRDAAAMLEDFTRELPSVKSDGGRVALGMDEDKNEKAGKSALFFDASVLPSAEKNGSLLGFDTVFIPLMCYPVYKKYANGVYIPPIVMENEIDDVMKALNAARECGAKFALVGNISHIRMAKDSGLAPIGDFRLNVMNKSTRYALKAMGILDTMTSPELTSRQAGAIGGRAVVYGRIPLMITERCFMKEGFGCDNCGKCLLVDRKGISFPMMREYKHRNIIFNSVPTYMGDKMSELPSGCRQHFIFSVESADDIRIALEGFSKGECPISPIRRMGKR